MAEKVIYFEGGPRDGETARSISETSSAMARAGRHRWRKAILRTPSQAAMSRPTPSGAMPASTSGETNSSKEARRPLSATTRVQIRRRDRFVPGGEPALGRTRIHTNECQLSSGSMGLWRVLGRSLAVHRADRNPRLPVHADRQTGRHADGHLHEDRGRARSRGDRTRSTATRPGTPTLTQRLAELRDAHDAGLITAEEYESRRASLIESV